MNKSTFEKLLDEYMNTNKLMEEGAKTAFNNLTSAYADFIGDFRSGNKSLAEFVWRLLRRSVPCVV